ncbi:MAG: penicillin acylase family protein [Saprospiraceae bacterium]|jgi:penicillin amidase|nr:penicillin acylase family protein [Saprospiraceae bacterium]
MNRTISFVLKFSLSVLLLLILHGEIAIPGMTIPPLGSILNPYEGVWATGLHSETDPISLEDPSLSAPVEILYDERRVPHIFAANLDDALFAQGFVEAQNRLFQMQFLAKAAAGELSAILGEKTISIDLEKRRRGMKFAAENAVQVWEKTPGFDRAQKYIDGVNRYIETLTPETMPLECRLLQFEPERWDILKSALVFKQMSQTLAGRNDDLEYTNLLRKLGKEEFDFLYPERQDVENAVIPDGTSWQFDSLVTYSQNQQSTLQEPIFKTFFPTRNPGIGSNSWGLAGTKTSTGHPIFCNDPHLSLSLPSIWFEVHIHTPEVNAYGVSFPGFPGIMIGFNEHIAWGETNVGQDVEDMFLIEWKDASRTTYLLDGKEEKATLRIEEIRVKGGQTILDTVKYTRWGPIYRTSADGRHDLAMRWLCHDAPDTEEFAVFVNAMSCKNYDEYLQATEAYISPAQNFGFACKDGDIALRVNGRFPARPPQDGRFVEYGNQSANGWLSYIPKAQLPQTRNPRRGYIASANQVSTDATYPYYFTGKFERYRNLTINSKLDSIQSASPEDMQRMQFNSYSSKAASMIRAIRTVLPEVTRQDKGKDLWGELSGWDAQYLHTSREAVLFDLFLKKCRENVWDEILQWKDEMDMKLPEDWRLIELIAKDPNHKYFDRAKTPVKESALTIIQESLVEAGRQLDSLTREGKGTWGKYRPLDIYHMMRLPAFSEMQLEVDGCPDAINATGQSFGPSWRMVVSLEDSIQAWGVYPGGQSGNPVSPYYKNMITTWKNGEYFHINLYETPESLRSRATQLVSLHPAKK